MRFYRVEKINDGFVIFEECYNLSSDRYQYVKKNSKLFSSYENALDYIYENSSPETRDAIKKQLEEEKKKKILDEYMKAKDNKEEFEKLFCIKLSDEGFANLRDFIEFVRNEEK